MTSVDGVALGAAASTAQAHVEMIVFIAIMLHKVSLVRGRYFMQVCGMSDHGNILQ